VVFHFYAVFWVTRFLKTGIKLENFRVSSDDNAKKPYFALGAGSEIDGVKSV
jgi:hypothetical protein